VIHAGGRLATSEGKLYDAKGRLLAHGTETCFVFDVPAAAAA
jgi:acyl-coenzyme A thioesterase PaaI-like protein